MRRERIYRPTKDEAERAAAEWLGAQSGIERLSQFTTRPREAGLPETDQWVTVILYEYTH
jgi:hypothetical protein